MRLGDYILALIDNILDLFDLVRGWIKNALVYFEKIKLFIEEVLDYFKDDFETIIDEDQIEALTIGEHYFI